MITFENKIMKKTFLFLIILMFCGCEPMYKMKYENIVEEMKPNLQDKDIVCFINHLDSRIIDTFVIERRDDYLLYDRTHSWERINLKYRDVNKQSVIKYFEIQLLSTDRFAISYYTPSDNCKTFDLEVDGKKYSVFGLKNISSETNTLPDSLYYSYKEGILQYYYSDTIYSKINNF